jgi:putative FmdB family regulatory protein
MPIYAYKCSSCGHAQDVLQKVSDAPLTVCTSCGAAAFAKQLTTAGFQLKGKGWYATDFKNGSGKKPDATKPDTATTDSKPAETSAPAPAAAPACGAGACPACS